ncbi:DNA-binding response regulator [Geothrix limicola]|uniref:DNA-binding response regulator n=1 Tax=Geothrix limicola TaxID=2927978 RepID=A0ABQ5QAR2_9BACT|nr:LytTR family DNA-binding domain-containing protein [Geothrix limicola]GLH71920.1 DNA-binding response regulator [Geothrix limicola]
MKRLKALVVDDEPLARERLSRLLQEADCAVVGELSDGQALLQWLKQPQELDVIFLDIQMPGPNGMEVLAEAPSCPPVVFVTAHSTYAVRAFELAAADYLLKPVFEDRLAKCLQRLRQNLVRPLNPSELKTLLPPPVRFPIRAGDGEIFMELDLITHFELQDDHVWACRGMNRYVTRWTTLSEVEQAFPDDGMLRIQRHLLLRPKMVRGIRPATVGRVKVMIAPKVELTVSRAMTPRMRAYLRTEPD